MAQQGLNECWPVPPESGWVLAKESQKDPQKGEKSFIDKWNGSFNFEGECKREEMYICFGKDFEASIFLKNKEFLKAHKILYGPIIEYLSI